MEHELMKTSSIALHRKAEILKARQATFKHILENAPASAIGL
jgi:hypothetical protein